MFSYLLSKPLPLTAVFTTALCLFQKHNIAIICQLIPARTLCIVNSLLHTRAQSFFLFEKHTNSVQNKPAHLATDPAISALCPRYPSFRSAKTEGVQLTFSHYFLFSTSFHCSLMFCIILSSLLQSPTRSNIFCLSSFRLLPLLPCLTLSFFSPLLTSPRLPSTARPADTEPPDPARPLPSGPEL